MTIFQAIILGIVQGATEFLPISSSGHLVLVPHLFGWEIPIAQAFVFDILVQLGTLLAVIVYFWRDLFEIAVAVLRGLWVRKPFEAPAARMGWYLVLATIPASVLGLLVKDAVEAAFGSPFATAMFLIGTAVLLVVAEVAGKRNRPFEQIDWIDALWMGVFQALALFPGVSRSGSTITGGMTRNLERPAAARFSFLMSVPVMLGAGLIAVLDLLETPDIAAFLPALVTGFLVSAVVGYIAIAWLLRYLVNHRLYVFSAYVVVVAIVTLITL